MRILIPYGRRPPFPPLGLHLTKAFRSLGHDARLLCVRDRPLWGKYTKRFPSPWKERWQWDPVVWANRILLKTVEKWHPEVILDIEGDLLEVSTLRRIKRKGTHLAVWLVEGPFPKGPSPTLFEYDIITSTSTTAVEQLRQAGLPQAAYLPFATDPEWFCPGRGRFARPRYPIGFIGAYSPRREELLERVVDLGLSLWGPAWDTKCSSIPLRQALRARRGIFGPGLVRCYQSAAIFINVQREHMMTKEPRQPVGTGLGWRHFDVPACGRFLLTEWVLELPEAFAIGQEVETFSTKEELRDKASYFLSHEVQREAMVRRAFARVLQEHTYKHRAQQWLELFNRTHEF